MQNYNKPYLSIAEQIDLLKSRGLIVDDSVKASHYLSYIGYYRLSGYSYVFRKSLKNPDNSVLIQDEFKEGVNFDHIHELYVFDKKLRMLLIDAIERIEVSLRVSTSLVLGKFERIAHKRTTYFRDSFLREISANSSHFIRWQEKLDQTLNRSKEDFVKHFKEKYYEQSFPIWMSVELWDFGMLSVFIDNLKDIYKAPIAQKYQIEKLKNFTSWLQTLNVIRNICAHHGRIWNRVIPTSPKIPKIDEVKFLNPLLENKLPNNKIFFSICIIQYLMTIISPNSSWKKRFISLIKNDFPKSDYLNLEMMGMPKGWEKWYIWDIN